MDAANRTFNFLFATWEGGGCVGPALTVAAKLVRRGHRVRLISDESNRADAVAAGADFTAWRRAPSRPDRSRENDLFRDWEAASPQEGLSRVVDRLMAGPARAYGEDLAEALDREPADLVVSNEMLFGVALACEARGQPFALLTANVSLFPLPGVPPMGPGLPPARNEEDRALHAAIADGGRQMFDAGLPALNAARAAFGLAPLATMADQLARAERLLLGTARAFDFAPETLPQQILYVGPQLDTPAWAAPWASLWPATDERPLVLVAFSTTFQNQAPILQRVIDALAALPVRGLVTLGGAIAPEALVPADNVRLVDSAPHDAVLREAALVVSYGGHGTVSRALIHRRPLLILPQGRDQNDNAVRVTERGAGLSLPADAGVQEIKASLQRLLGEPGFAAAARALGAKVAAEAAQSPVVAELERLAAKPAWRAAPLGAAAAPPAARAAAF